MPKMKTNSSAKKRFKVTGTGKIKRNKAYLRHILTKKSNKQKNRLRHSGLVSPGDTDNIKRLLTI
jgi:large subunit ribosomal protein L35